MSAAKGIGTAKEKSLHASLKLRYAGSDGKVEAAVGRYVCDAVRGDGVIVEVQTGNFGSIVGKLTRLATTAPVTLVYPIPSSRVIELRDPAGALLRRRRSPRRGSYWDLFGELVRAPRLPLIPGLSIELVLVDETELRVNDGAGSWRRKGVSVIDRRLDAVRDSLLLERAEDYGRFLPPSLPREFGRKELSEAGGVRKELAGKALYVLKRIALIEEVGKRGNAKLYRRT